MIGMDRSDGRSLGGDAHLQQSLAVLLTTPKGARVMRRDYGVDLTALIDAPLGQRTAVDFFMACAEAVARWEPRFALRRVRISDAGPDGAATVTLSGVVDGRDTETGVVIGAALLGGARTS